MYGQVRVKSLKSIKTFKVHIFQTSLTIMLTKSNRLMFDLILNHFSRYQKMNVESFLLELFQSSLQNLRFEQYPKFDVSVVPFQHF